MIWGSRRPGDGRTRGMAACADQSPRFNQKKIAANATGELID
jgi:hypothetical protein